MGILDRLLRRIERGFGTRDAERNSEGALRASSIGESLIGKSFGTLSSRGEQSRGYKPGT